MGTLGSKHYHLGDPAAEDYEAADRAFYREMAMARRGEKQTSTDCPNNCGATLKLLLVDRLYYCERCAQEFEFTEVDSGN